jgi:hypothetical protein
LSTLSTTITSTGTPAVLLSFKPWQLHFAVAGGADTNVADVFIANPAVDLGEYLKVTAEPSGAFTVVNHRNKYTKTYPAK